MAIFITPNEAIIEALNNFENSSIQFSDTGFFMPHIAGAAVPAQHGLQSVFPAFDQLPAYAGYTGWKARIKTNIDNSPALWVFTNGTFAPLIDLPEPTADDSGAAVYIVPLTVKPINVMNMLSAGNYNIILTLEVYAMNMEGAEVVVAQKRYPVQAAVTNTAETFFYPTYFNQALGGLHFLYAHGSHAIVSQKIFVWHNVAFEADLDINISLLALVVSEPEAGRSVLSLSYAEGLEPAPGEYSGTITLSPVDGNVVLIPVTVSVLALEAEPIAVLPLAMDFVAVIGEVPAPGPKTLNILTTGAWSITDLPSWLQVNKLTGYGSQAIIVTVDDFEGLQPGNYLYNIIVHTAGGHASVSVQLTVTGYLTNPFTSGGLYFSEDLDYLDFTSPNINSRLLINLNMVFYTLGLFRPVSYTRQYELPLFQGKGYFHPGTAVHQLFDEINDLKQAISTYNANHIAPQYQPARVDVYFSEISYDDDIVLRSGAINDIKMAIGVRPLLASNNSGVLNVTGQDVSRITANSIISCAFKADNPQVLVKKNGVVIDSFILYTARECFYNYYRFNDKLVPGDSLEIMLKGDYSRTRRFLVFPEGRETTHLFFENQNGLVESFEFTGRRRLGSAYAHTTSERFADLYSYQEKVNVKNVQNLIINTGYMLPNDHKIIDAIIKSRRVWCSFDSAAGYYYRVDATSSKITNADTDVFEVAYDVEFNILDNADVAIYTQ